MLIHKPVLKEEVIRIFDPKSNQNFIDCTVGTCGHALAILEKTYPKGKVLGIDIDADQIKNCKERAKAYLGRLILVQDNFANLKKIVQRYNFYDIAGILFDLGISSWHLEESERGFSFLREEPLKMTFKKEDYDLSAYEIVNFWPYQDLVRIFKEYGQERFAEKIAEKIVEFRKEKKISTTKDLVEIIRRALSYKELLKRKKHFATKIFQALRIAVNRELENLEKALPQALEILPSGGKLIVISFHSLEDRIVKNFFRERFKEGRVKLITKKPIIPSQDEVESNPRSRSAKLRALIKK